MFEPLTLSVSELADRWKMTPRQILDFAGQPFLPLYFDFDGLAFDELDWLRSGGDQDQRKELENLRTDISKNEAWIRRSARGETGDHDHLSSKDAQELRQKIEANKRKCADLVELLEQREVDRKGQHYRGNMRIMPQTLDEIRRTGEAYEPWSAFHPQPPVKSAMLRGRGLGGTYPISDGRIMFLEAFKPRTLTIDSLYAGTAEVKAIEAWKKAKETPQPAPIEQADTQPQPAPVGEAPARENGKAEIAPGNWKMKIQAEAASRFKRLRASGASPTVHSILDDLVTWCRDNDVKTDGHIYPSANYLRTHVLGGKHWTPPR